MEKTVENGKKSVIVIGGGIMGLGTCLHLAERGYKVTLLEKQSDVAKVASYINGAMICPSMTASWASLKLLSQNRGEIKRIQLSWDAVTDHKFWRWGMWFTFNCIFPGKVKANDEAQQTLGLYSLKCLKKLEETYGEEVLAYNKTATNSIRLFYSQDDMQHFFNTSQAHFWQKHGAPFMPISPEKCREMLSWLGEYHPKNKTLAGAVVNVPSIDSSGDIHQFCQNVKQLCIQKGVDIKTNCEVKEIQTQNDPDTNKKVVSGVQLTNGKVEKANIYVLALGIMANPMGRSIGINLPVYPLKGNIVTVPLKEPLEMNVYSPDHGSLICPLKPNLGRISGGVQAVGFNWRFNTEGCQDILENTEKVFANGYIDASKREDFAGLRPVSADDIPIIGQSIVPNLYVITGHGSKGWTLSFGSSALLADIIDGKSTQIDATPYSPLRFHPIRNMFNKIF